MSVIPTDIERLDEGKQTEPTHAPEWIGPPKLLAPDAVADEEVVMEMRDGGDVPRVTCQGARAETGHIVDETADDNSNDLQGKSGGGGAGCRGGLKRSTPGTHPLDSGLTSIPNSFDE